MRASNWLCATVVAATLVGRAAGADVVRDDALLRTALTDELTRTLQELVLPAEAKPYYAAYTVLDVDGYGVSADHGALIVEAREPARQIAVSLRVGTPELDSSNAGFAGGFSMASQGASSLDDDYLALRRELWLLSDLEYKQALESLAQKRSLLSVRVRETSDAYPDFAAEPRHETVVPAPPIDIGTARPLLREAVQRLSGLAGRVPQLLDSSARAQTSLVRRRLLNSEQTWADETHAYTQLKVFATTQADDGMRLSTQLEFSGTSAESLPTLEVMERETAAALARLTAAREAPLAKGGTAVILFEGRAAAQLIQSLLAHRLSGAPPVRYVGADNDRSLASKLGLVVLSPTLDVFDDPTLTRSSAGDTLFGHYAADDEGVPARRVSLIERGVLKTLLMSRSPRKEIRESNAHYRFRRGVAIGNLVVKPRRSSSRSALLKLAEAEAKKQSADAKVYVVRRLAPVHEYAGPALHGHIDPAIELENGASAAEAYLVTKGVESPVRGLQIERIDLRALKTLLGAGAEAYTLNLGPIPSSIVTPSLLLGDIDVKAYDNENPKLPNYPAP